MVELCTNILKNAKLKIGKRSENRAEWGSPLRRRRSALDCNAIEEEEEQEQEEGWKMCGVELATWETGG